MIGSTISYEFCCFNFIRGPSEKKTVPRGDGVRREERLRVPVKIDGSKKGWRTV